MYTIKLLKHRTSSTLQSPYRRHPWTSVHSFYASTGGFTLYDGSEYWSLEPKGILYMIASHRDLVPDISSDAISDKSKAGKLSKLIAVVQIFWFGTQCITRLAQHLPLSILELNTLIHSLFAMITYGFWWNKPFDISIADSITLPSGQRGKDIFAHLAHHKLIVMSTKHVSMPVMMQDMLPLESDWWRYKFFHKIVALGSLSIIYGCLHMAAWHSSFPSNTEGIIWRSTLR